MQDAPYSKKHYFHKKYLSEYDTQKTLLRPLEKNLSLYHTQKPLNYIVGLVWFGLVWLGLAWLGLAWLGLAWLGLAWLGLVRLG